MSIRPDCVPCIMKQALRSAAASNIRDDAICFEILHQVYHEVMKRSTGVSAPMFSSTIQKIVRSYSDIDDPYRENKTKNIEKVIPFIPFLRSYINSSNDRLEAALRVAILGNVIDLGANPDFDLDEEIKRIDSNMIAEDDYHLFKNDLAHSESVLYIGDNAEEAIFDKLFIEQLAPRRIYFAVRDLPVLNDITLEYAQRLEIDAVAEVISSGSTIPGTDMSSVRRQFRRLFATSPMVIAKGQGNYETLLNEQRPIFFLFKVKCSVIAQACGKPVGASVLLYKRKT